MKKTMAQVAGSRGDQKQFCQNTPLIIFQPFL